MRPAPPAVPAPPPAARPSWPAVRARCRGSRRAGPPGTLRHPPCLAILSRVRHGARRRADNSPVLGTLGFQEILLICFVALVVVGPRQLVSVAGKLGRLYGELKRKLSEA